MKNLQTFKIRINTHLKQCLNYLRGDKIIIILRPSRLGFDSIFEISSRALASFKSTNSPFSVYSISRPRNWTEALTLSPLLKNSRACLVLNSRSWSSVFGRNRSSLTVTVCCFFLASFSFFFFSYWYLP